MGLTKDEMEQIQEMFPNGITVNGNGMENGNFLIANPNEAFWGAKSKPLDMFS